MRKTIAGLGLASALILEATPAAAAQYKHPCPHAYTELTRGHWHARGFDATFYPASGCGLTTTWGGYGKPTGRELTVRGVQAGSGRLVVSYDFAARPDRVRVFTGDDTLYAHRR